MVKQQDGKILNENSVVQFLLCRQRFFNLHPFREVEAKEPIRGHVTVDQRSQRSQVLFLHLLELPRFCQYTLNQ